MTRVERWLAYFSNKLNTEEMEELVMSDSAIKNAVNDTGIFMQDIDERLKYINRQMSIMDYNTDMTLSRKEVHKAGRRKKAHIYKKFDEIKWLDNKRSHGSQKMNKNSFFLLFGNKNYTR